MRTFKIFFVSFLMLFAQPIMAQMSDQQVKQYIRDGMNQGKSEQELGRELILRGVSRAQLERIGRQSESENDDAVRSGERNALQQSRERVRDASELAGDYELSGYTDSGLILTTAVSEIYGHNIFRSRNLSFEPNENISTPENYKLGPGDEVIIDIWGTNEDTIRQTISPEGDIMVSQIGPVYLNGLTIREAGNKIRDIFSRKYASVSGDDPTSDIRVSLGRIRTIQVDVMGEVVTPGTYRLSGFSSLFNALYRAGGITQVGSLRKIQLVRSGRVVAVADVYDYLFNGKMSSDVKLQEGDVIIVPAYEALVSIEGNVKRPMLYELTGNETLADLIAYAGGFSGDAYTKELRIVRQSGGEHQILSVSEDAFGKQLLEDGDAVSVDAALDRFANMVEIRGAVYRPGVFELASDGMTVSQLVAHANGLAEDAFLPRAQLIREQDDLTLEMIAVDLGAILAGIKPDIFLRRNDILIISSISELEDRGDVTINGEVSHPGVYAYADNMSIEDLVLLAGGLRESASTVMVEVSRRLKNPKSTATSNAITQIFRFSLKDGLIIDGNNDFTLQPYDVVDIRRSPAYQEQRRMTVQGEVLFPGRYTIARKNERISDVIARAGGLTEDAYIRGARLVRRMNDEERAIQNDALKLAMRDRGRDSLSVESVMIGDFYTVGIQLDKALENPGSDFDIVLREEDTLIIPEFDSTVRISGAVMYPNTVNYVNGKKLSYYINQAGGFGVRAKRSKAYVIYMNGTVSRVRRCKSHLEPGCQIIVPTKRERSNLLSLPELMSLTTSAASLGTMAATITNLVNNTKNK